MFISFTYFRRRESHLGTIGEKTFYAGAYAQLHTCECICSRKKEKEEEKKKESPVRWSGLISEISTAKRSLLLPLSLSLSWHKCIHASPFPSPLFPSLHRPRGNLQALLTSAIIVLARAASHFYFYFLFLSFSFEIPRARSIIAVARKYRNATAVCFLYLCISLPRDILLCRTLR